MWKEVKICRAALDDVYISPELILMDIEAKTDQEAIEIHCKIIYMKKGL